MTGFDILWPLFAAAFSIGAVVVLARAIAGSLREENGRANPRWRGVEAGRVPVHTAPAGAYREAGTVPLHFGGVPRAIRLASSVAGVAMLAALAHAVFLVAVVMIYSDPSEVGAALLVVPGALVLSLSSVLELDAARLAVLKRVPRAAWRASLVAVPHALVASGALVAPFALAPRPPAAWILIALCALLSAGVAAAILLVRRVALAHRDAIDHSHAPAAR